MSRRKRGVRDGVRRWVAGAATAALLLAVGVGLVFATRAPSFLSVVVPADGQVIGLEGVEVMVHFIASDRVESGTFRLLLNGSDVTRELTTGANGAYGRLYALLDGENVLRFSVFGRRWFPSSELVEQIRETTVVARRPLDLDRG